MREKMNTPTLRFGGFENVWEQRKLGDCFAERVESMPDGELISVTINDGIKKFSELGRQDNSNDDKSKYKKVCIGDIAYNSMRMWQGASGYSPYEGIVSPAYTVLSPKAGINSRCLAYQFKLSDVIHVFQVNSQGITSDNWNLKYPVFSEIEIPVSPNVEEQGRIADFFGRIDNLIAIHQRKYEKLQAFKASMLEKMFPKDGADVPEMRMKGFEKPWQTLCLKTIASEITRTDKASDAPIMMITAANGFIDQSDRYSFNNAGQSLAKYIVLKKCELAYNHGASKLRPYGSCFALEVDEARIPYVYHCFALREHNPYFISRVLNNKETEKQLRRLVTSGARMDGLLNISYEEYTTISIQVPVRAEQDRIAAYFKNMEDLIILYQQEYEKLQSLKKALLEKMFV